MIRGKENLIEWVKSTPNVKQIQIRTSPGADAFQFQSEEGENKKDDGRSAIPNPRIFGAGKILHRDVRRKLPEKLVSGLLRAGR